MNLQRVNEVLRECILLDKGTAISKTKLKTQGKSVKSYWCHGTMVLPCKELFLVLV